MLMPLSGKPFIGDRQGTTKKLCDKDFAERSGELSGAIRLKTWERKKHMNKAWRFTTRIGAIRANRFERKTLICLTCEQFARVTVNLRFASFSPRSVIRKKGVQLGNPETIRENQAIRANLRIDSRESGHLRRKHIKKKTRKQNFHGIVPGFWGDFVYVFFSPRRNDQRKHINKLLAPIQSRDNPANLFCFFFPSKKNVFYWVMTSNSLELLRKFIGSGATKSTRRNSA